MKKIRIAIVEDDINWLKSMVNFLSRYNDMEVAGTALSSNEAFQLVGNCDIDVLLLDINLSGNKRDGIFAAVEILQIKSIKIIMLTSLSDEDIIIDAFNAGAVNYIIKDKYQMLPDVIRKTMEGPSPINVLLKEFQRMKHEEQLKEFSPSEKELFSYMEKGYTQLQIEKLLYKTQSTIKTQVKSILRKLKVSSSKEAVKKVKNRGLTKDSD